MKGTVVLCRSGPDFIEVDLPSGGYPNRVQNKLRLATFFPSIQEAEKYCEIWQRSSSYRFEDMKPVIVAWEEVLP